MASLSHVGDLLFAASQGVRTSDDGQKPWNYGWCIPDYRRSEDARLSSSAGTARMEVDAVADYESATEALLRDQEVAKRWDSEELWGVVASLVVFLWENKAPIEDARRQVARLRNARPSFVLLPVANVQWSGPPMRIGTALMGSMADPAFTEEAAALGPDVTPTEVETHFGGQQLRSPVVGFATVVPGQHGMAFEQASKRLQYLCDLALLLVVDKQALRLWSSRGAWNRPGVRGLSLDRSVVEEAFRRSEDRADLGSDPLVVGETGRHHSFRWYSAEPLPLESMLSAINPSGELDDLLSGDSGDSGPVARVRLAARWFAEYFWSTESDYGMLALGVALDALIGSNSGLPGRAMRERFAFLERNLAQRPARAARYDDILSARSSVAHGGRSRRLGESGFVRSVADEVTWAAWRMLDAAKCFELTDEHDVERLFDNLRWGLAIWPPDEGRPTAGNARAR